VPSLVLHAYVKLVHFDLYLGRQNFGALHAKVHDYPVRSNVAASPSVEQICAAVDAACIWYWKEVLCLQRSAATACLLRWYALPAQMIIGAQQEPFKAHAWVEIDGRVVNDKPYMREIYAVLEKC
jgi:hypothetical protein